MEQRPQAYSLMEISARARNYFQILLCKKGKLFAGEYSWGSDDGGKGQKDKKESFHIAFSSCHMKETPAVRLNECEQEDVHKLPKRPSVGRRGEGGENYHEIKLWENCYSCYFCHPDLRKEKWVVPIWFILPHAIGTSQVLLVRGNSVQVLVIHL